MAKNIANGIEQLMKVDKINKTATLSAGWKELRNKLDILLLSNNIMKTNETTMACKALDTMSHEDRIEYIKRVWGPLYAEKTMPLLLQLLHLEKQLVD